MCHFIFIIITSKSYKNKNTLTNRVININKKFEEGKSVLYLVMSATYLGFVNFKPPELLKKRGDLSLAN